MTDPSTHQLIDETVGHVDAFWREHRAPMLLSVLGNVDHGRISQGAKLHATSLRGFLKQFVAERVLIVEHSTNSTIVGAVPRNEDTRAIQDWDALLGRPATASAPRRLHPGLWAAFRKPIHEATERYVQAGETVHFSDVAAGEEVPEGIRVDSKFVVGPEASTEAVYESAVAWLKENQLDVSSFQTESGTRASAKLPSNDLLGKLILALDPPDLQKITIPMEVVAKLRRQSV